MITVGKVGLKIRRDQLDVGVNGAHFCQGRVPKAVEIVRAGVGSLVFQQFVEGHIKQKWHDVVSSKKNKLIKVYPVPQASPSNFVDWHAILVLIAWNQSGYRNVLSP
jgi:hypothetical protein